MWRYSNKIGWEKIENFLSAAGHGHTLEEELETHGFSSSSSFTTGREGKIRVKIYRNGPTMAKPLEIDPATGQPEEELKKSAVEDEFLAVVEVCRHSYKIVLPAFPDLFEFLSRIGTICSAVKIFPQLPIPTESQTEQF